MSRIVRCSLIQATNAAPPDASLSATKQAMIDKHVAYIEQAAKAGAQIVCLQEIFYGPYFCAEQTTKWYDFTEPIPDGPTIRLMQSLAKQHHIALIVPIYEIEQAGVYYNTAAVIHNDGAYLGKYRKSHIPHVAPGFWEKFYFRPGNLGYPVFKTQYADTASTSVMTDTSPRARASSGSMVRRSSSIPRQPWRACPSICGSLSSRRTRWRTRSSSERSIASASRSRGTSGSSTARATSAIRADSFWPRPAVIETSSSRRSWIWNRSAKSGTSGSSSATGDPRLTQVFASSNQNASDRVATARVPGSSGRLEAS